MRSLGLHRVYAKERALGTSMSRLRETSTLIRQKNGGKTSTRRYFPVGTSKSSFSFTKTRRRWFSRTQLSTSSWIRYPNLGARRPSSAACTIPAGKYSLACGCRYYCSIERLKQHSQKSTLGDRSALCSAMAGVSSLMATKSSGGYLEGWRLESKTHSAAQRANFRLCVGFRMPAMNDRAMCTVDHAPAQRLQPGKTGVFSRKQACQGKSQSP